MNKEEIFKKDHCKNCINKNTDKCYICINIEGKLQCLEERAK